MKRKFNPKWKRFFPLFWFKCDMCYHQYKWEWAYRRPEARDSHPDTYYISLKEYMCKNCADGKEM